MIQFLAKLFLGSSYSWIAWLVLASVFAGYTGYIYHQGYSTASTKWELKYNTRELELARELAIEQDRQYQANQRAKELETRRINELKAKELELESLINANNTEATKSPNSGRIGLDLDSVLRLDQIK